MIDEFIPGQASKAEDGSDDPLNYPGYAADESVVDVNGFREIKDNPLSRVGVFPYSGRSLAGAPDPDKTYMVYRPAEELGAAECIESFRLLPWIDNHAHALLGNEDDGLLPSEKKGVQGVIGEDVYFDEGAGTLYGNLKVFSQTLEGLIDSGKRELSCGYRCKYEWTPGTFKGRRYDCIQRVIRGNHVALVDAGRMGPEVSVMDGQSFDRATFTFDAKEIAMDDENNPTGNGAMTLEDAVRVIEQVMPAFKAIQALAAAAGNTPGGIDQSAGGADSDKNSEADPGDKAPDDSGAGNADLDDEDAAKSPEKPRGDGNLPPKEDGKEEAPDGKKEGQGMDAKDFKRFISQVAERDRLAHKLSEHLGTFDHAEMTRQEVAQYGIKRLGIKAAPGREIYTLDGYLQAKPVPRKQPVANAGKATAHAADSANADNFVSRFLKGGK